LFIRLAFGHEVHARMLYQNMTLEVAINDLIHGEMVKLDNGAGACAIDRDGNVMLPYNTEGMYRGWIRPEGVFVAIHET
jgi:L-asparaginase / beta-aspartyl-peptidase